MAPTPAAPGAEETADGPLDQFAGFIYPRNDVEAIKRFDVNLFYVMMQPTLIGYGERRSSGRLFGSLILCQCR